jgi:hypothetical protein
MRFITKFMPFRAAYIEAVISSHMLVIDQSPLRLTWVIRGNYLYERWHVSDMQLALRRNRESSSEDLLSLKRKSRAKWLSAIKGVSRSSLHRQQSWIGPTRTVLQSWLKACFGLDLCKVVLQMRGETTSRPSSYTLPLINVSATMITAMPCLVRISTQEKENEGLPGGCSSAKGMSC